ncbi:hypothetical protein [Salinactinospora qingdaonensis]|uniref:Uncharacterized protein n=1 Tax=Salinactinospora qingdaonensis TaxID=702744 RepID=A0ABP7EYS2_9ACTN
MLLAFSAKRSAGRLLVVVCVIAVVCVLLYRGHDVATALLFSAAIVALGTETARRILPEVSRDHR